MNVLNVQNSKNFAECGSQDFFLGNYWYFFIIVYHTLLCLLALWKYKSLISTCNVNLKHVFMLCGISILENSIPIVQLFMILHNNMPTICFLECRFLLMSEHFKNFLCAFFHRKTFLNSENSIEQCIKIFVLIPYRNIYDYILYISS